MNNEYSPSAKQKVTRALTINSDTTYKILYASSEVYPFIKTGGLADVANNLPKALDKLGHDIRIIMPGYRDALANAGAATEVARVNIGNRQFSILEANLPGSSIKVWLLEAEEFSSRAGDPYSDLQNTGAAWPDNAQRFNLFCRVVSSVALDIIGLNWQADIVHCNDWQTGLVPVHLLESTGAQQTSPPLTVFTIHNLAYQGLFPYSTFLELGLNQSLWRFDALEYYQQMSFIKGGMVFSDWVNTVSPQYALEIQTPELGQGLDGLLRYRKATFSGILNGIDTREWDPEKDPSIVKNYNYSSINEKSCNKLAMQGLYGLEEKPNVPMLAFVGRFAEQKGLDILIKTLPTLLKKSLQLVILGSGDRETESDLRQWARRYPKKMAVIFSYDESLAHQIISSSDFFLMPSRFEPCGLTQLYSLRYGTIPVGHNTGGLVDTIVSVNERTLADHTATGFLFDQHNESSMVSSIEQALKLYKKPRLYQSVQRTAMLQDYSWERSAQHYASIYHRISRKDKAGKKATYVNFS